MQGFQGEDLCKLHMPSKICALKYGVSARARFELVQLKNCRADFLLTAAAVHKQVACITHSHLPVRLEGAHASVEQDRRKREQSAREQTRSARRPSPGGRDRSSEPCSSVKQDKLSKKKKKSEHARKSDDAKYK